MFVSAGWTSPGPDRWGLMQQKSKLRIDHDLTQACPLRMGAVHFLRCAHSSGLSSPPKLSAQYSSSLTLEITDGLPLTTSPMSSSPVIFKSMTEIRFETVFDLLLDRMMAK